MRAAAYMHANVQGLRGREKANPIMSDVGVTGAAGAPVACILSQCNACWQHIWSQQISLQKKLTRSLRNMFPNSG